MNSLKLISTLLFTLALLTSCGGSSSKKTTTPATTTPSTPTTAAPVLASTTIVTTNGKTIQVDKTAGGLVFHGYEGKIVLLEAYGDSCPHCQDAIPAYNNLKTKYPNDVYVIALETYGNLDNAGLQQYAKTHNIQYDTVAKQNAGELLSFMHSLIGSTPPGVPYLTVHSRNGDLAEYIFAPDLNYVENLIQGLL